MSLLNVALSMFKKLIITYFVIILSIFSEAQAVDLSKVASDKVGEFFSNLIPGEGLTEVSIDLREHKKPDFSILGTRELKKNDNGNYFMQFSLFSHEQNNDERYTGNLGFGKRILSDDKL
jgi:hypothetical protein